MLSGQELRDYRELRSLSLRDVAAYCELTPQHIGDVERGDRNVTTNSHQQIIDGINKAFFAKTNGTFSRPPITKNKSKKTEKTKDK